MNRPRSIYQYSGMAPRLSGQNCKFFKFLLSLNSQKRLEYKENNTKYRSLTWKPRSHVRILIYRTWPISIDFDHFTSLFTPEFLFWLKTYIKHSTQSFIGYSNTSNFVKNLPLRIVFLTLFSVLGCPYETLSLSYFLKRYRLWRCWLVCHDTVMLNWNTKYFLLI